jgi:hypothetical protein
MTNRIGSAAARRGATAGPRNRDTKYTRCTIRNARVVRSLSQPAPATNVILALKLFDNA